MLAEPSVQRILLRLAELDAELARVTHTAKSLPQHESIAKLMVKRQHANDELTAATTNADDLEVAVRKAEQDLVPVRARLERDQERIDSGAVTDAKALQGLLGEIEHLQRRIADLEDAELELMGQREEALVARDQLVQRCREVEDLLRAEVKERDTRVAELKQEAQGIIGARPRLVKQLPEPLLKLYERLRAATGLGAATLAHGRCGGCRLELNVSDLKDLALRPANEVTQCPECDRILVRQEQA